MPAFNVATRGLCYFHVRVRTGERDLHSGMYGGAALNAIARADADALGAVHAAATAALPEPLRAGRRAADRTRSSRAGRAAVRRRGARRGRARARSTRRGRGVLRCARGPSRPSTSTGSRAARRTCRRRCCRCCAEANVSIRLAPGPGSRGRSRPTFERLLREAAPEGADVEVERWSSSAAGPRPARRAGDPARRSTRSSASLGARPLLIRSGGTLPIVPALADKGDPDDHHRLRAARLEHPLAERAAARRVHPARRRGGARAARQLRRC